MTIETYFDGNFNKEKDTILFFSPEGGAKPHLYANSVLAKTLQDLGYQVKLLVCTNQFTRCHIMDSSRVPYNLTPEEKFQHICLPCIKNTEEALNYYQLPHLNLADYTTQEVRSIASQTVGSAGRNLLNVEYDGINFGYAGAFDVHLILKKLDLQTLDDSLWEAWRQYTENCLVAYLSIKKVCEQFSVKRICTFNKYSLLQAGAFVAKNLKIPFLNVTCPAHRSIDIRRFVIIPSLYTAEFWADMTLDWYRWRDLALTPDDIKEITDDLIQRQIGTGAQHYSPAKTFEEKNWKSEFNLEKDRKLLVAYTSTLDEHLSEVSVLKAINVKPSFKNEPFKDQVEWLKALTKYVEESDDLQLIVRIHPRESANKRESRTSEHLDVLKENFDKNYNHCNFVWPEDPVSSYDLAEIADLCLTSFTSLGMEFPRYGIPVVTTVRRYHYVDDDFLLWGGEDQDEYFRTIRSSLSEKPKIDVIKRAFRGYAYYAFHMSVFLDDLYPHSEYHDLVEYNKPPREASAIENVFIKGDSLLKQNRKKLVDAQNEFSNDLETQAIVKQLNRFIHFSLTGEDTEENLTIVKLSEGEASNTQIESIHDKLLNAKLPVLYESNNYLYYYYKGKSFVRNSKAFSRLSSLCCEKINTINEVL